MKDDNESSWKKKRVFSSCYEKELGTYQQEWRKLFQKWKTEDASQVEPEIEIVYLNQSFDDLAVTTGEASLRKWT